MAKAMDEQTAIRVLAEKYETIILANEDIGACKVIHKGDSLRDLSNLRLYMGLTAGVNLSIQQVYEPLTLNQPYQRVITMLHGNRDVVCHTKNKPKVIDPNKWECECGEENDYRDSKRRVKKKGTEHQCGVCLQWTKVESERVAG
jgi:hypothetical protein